MDDKLLAVIHRHAEDREIDYTSAKIIGEQYGKVFHNEKDLVEWKQLIDKYLKTFNEDDFTEIEDELGINEDEDNDDQEECPKCKKKMKKGVCTSCGYKKS